MLQIENKKVYADDQHVGKAGTTDTNPPDDGLLVDFDRMINEGHEILVRQAEQKAGLPTPEIPETMTVHIDGKQIEL